MANYVSSPLTASLKSQTRMLCTEMNSRIGGRITHQNGAKCVYRPNSRRSLFIQTVPTPNINALKFNIDKRILPAHLQITSLEYLSRRSALTSKYRSPLATKLLDIDGVISILLGIDFVTITKDAAYEWAHLKPEVFTLLTECVHQDSEVIKAGPNNGPESTKAQSISEISPGDEEIVGMINELLDTRIRPSVQEDGGDVEFCDYKDGNVRLRLKGACRTCDSSTMTLKNGIEKMMMHYIQEVTSVSQVLSPEEAKSEEEFAKFEETLALRKSV